MADFEYSDDPELRKLARDVREDPEDFNLWDKLISLAESQEGGLNRNSSPQAIAATRDTYDTLLAKFPLFFGYWKKYADLEFSIGGTEAAEMVYERGVASVSTSVDLWANFCSFKVETSHDADVIRELFERAAESVGLDFLAHPFWDKYLEFEERLDAQDKIFAILDRIIHIPMHQYARYFERYRTMAQNRPLAELAPAEVVTQTRQEIQREPGNKQKNESDIDREVRTRLDAFHLDIFQRTQNETNKRWTYESEVKRPYYHVTELDEAQVFNWRKYLDFEEEEGDYTRIKFLYERCIVTAANYDEFWFRYARWLNAQANKTEEARSVYQRASFLYIPMSRPAIRLHYAYFEEAQGRPDVANDIHEAVLEKYPGHQDTILSLVNLRRRQDGFNAAVETAKKYLAGPECTSTTRGALVAEWARLLWKVKAQVEEARKVYQDHQRACADSKQFWATWLQFELNQPTSESDEALKNKHIKAVIDGILHQSRLPADTARELASLYLSYLQERGGKDAMKDFLELDKELNGPTSISKMTKLTDSAPGDQLHKRATAGNGLPDTHMTGQQAKPHSQPSILPINGQVIS